jgi:hypothetical protein
MLVGWGVLSPVSKFSGWAPGPVGDMTSGARGWILWISLAIMCADSLVSLLPVVTEYVTHLLSAQISYLKLGYENADSDKEDHECETEDRLVPVTWVIGGLIGSMIIGTILVYVVFGNEGIKPWATLIGFLMGGLLSILGSVMF